MKQIFLLFLFVCICVPALASAHEPRIVEDRETTVSSPEISKAYYGQLTGVPDVFTIIASSSFNLYVNVLVPDIAGQSKDISAVITKNGQPFATLDGTQFTWKPMFEPFGYDNYFTGPEYKARAEAGTYVITVTSGRNNSKYSLAVGETENFDFPEIINALTLVPELKHTFFNESPANFIFSPFGWGLIITLYVLAAIVGLVYRAILKYFAQNTVRSVSRNIGTSDRVFRFAIAIALLVWAITTTWSPLLIFLSGFALFEALFSWCGLYAAFGKSTCPIV
jgi:hypothetical protein